MRNSQARTEHPLALTSNFPLKICTTDFTLNSRNGETDRMIVPKAARRRETRHIGRIAYRRAFCQIQMQSYIEFRICLGQSNRRLECPAIHHQTGRSDNSFTMRKHNGIVDSASESEVISSDDKFSRPAG